MLFSLVRSDRLAVGVVRKLAPLNEFIARGIKCQSGALHAQSAAAEAGKHKTIDDLPGPSLTTTAYWLFIKGYADKSHAMQVEHKRLYGPIWRSRFGPFDVVNVASADLIKQVILQEGRYPVRTDLSHWKEYRDMRGQATGPEWYRIRSALNPKMLKLKEAAAYAPIVHEVVSDLLQRLELLRLRSHDQRTIHDLASELYKFGFEGISSILFETRLGCLQEEIPTDTLRFITAVNDMLTLSETVLFFPRWSRGFFPFWKRFVQAWDELIDVARSLIDKKVKQIEDQMSCGEQVEGMYLTYLLSSNKLSLAEVYISITELLLGGVDTTSNTLSWTLYHLARDAEIQKRLYDEVISVCPKGELPTTDHLSRMPFMKAVIKETLSHDENEFPDAERFIPERWLRDSPSRSQHHPYSSVPFGVGVRACVGKRVAELEMYFALCRLVQHYEFSTVDGAPTIQPKTRTLLIPSEPIDLRFLPRA
ncbi:Sterol 26-hydroxylase, mitochondrial [Triplophysa tibetana]|uniref:Sterol 26-hydroxylase, mitochondrial n=1 Tax=Triplophysa tibetana TaxID=1572043 RepID=A0A5A9NW09_9TELE|nr:Sterol 26-hydroxylase, mitochondrial [Triplophysa tibetana]